MAAHNIQLTNDDLIAEYVPLDQFKGVLEQTIGIGPDLLAMVIRNGEVVSATHGGHIGIGGIWRTVKDAVLGQHALRLLIADLKPFQLVCGVNALSRDNVRVQGEIAIEFQVNPDQPSGVLGLMREHSSVVKDEVMVRFAPHLGDRVLEAAVRQVDAADLRGNTAVQDKVQAEAMREVERIAGDMSLLVRAVSLRWAQNEEEAAAIEKRNIERDQEHADVEFAAMSRDLEREHQSTKLKLSTKLDLEKVQAASEAEMRQLLLSQELAFSDARDTGIRLQEMEILEHEYAKLKREREEKFSTAIAAAENDIEKARLTEGLRKVQRETETFDAEHRLKLQRIQADQERDQKEKDRQQAQEAQRAEWEHAERVRDANIDASRRLDADAREDASGKADISIKLDDAEHRRAMEQAKLAQDTELEKLRLMQGQSPEVILAINAGLSPAVANVLVEQAKAQAGSNAEINTLLREQISQAKDAKLESAEQAKHFFETAMQGNVGVAQATSGETGGAQAASAPGTADDELTQCVNPDCRKSILVSARFCHHCGQQMRT